MVQYIPQKANKMFQLRVDDEISLMLVSSYRADDVYALIDSNREHIGEFLPWLTPEYNRESYDQFIAMARQDFAKQTAYGTIIYYKDQPAGAVGLHVRQSSSHEAEIGYWLGKTFTGKGIMTRAVASLLDFAFGTLSLQRVYIRCAINNTASCAIPKRLGFQHEGTLRKQVHINGTYQNVNMFSILRGEWDTGGRKPEFELRLNDQFSIRPFQHRHLDAALQAVTDNRDRLLPWLPWAENITREGEQQFIEKALEKYGRDDGFEAGIWDGDKLAGSIGYHFFDRTHNTTEIGYWIDQHYAGQGLVTQACNRLIRHAFVDQGINRLEIRCAVANERSAAVAKRLGMQLEGTLRQEFKSGSDYFDMYIFSLLKGEWQDEE